MSLPVFPLLALAACFYNRATSSRQLFARVSLRSPRSKTKIRPRMAFFLPEKRNYLGENLYSSVRFGVRRFVKSISALLFFVLPVAAAAQAPGTGGIAGTVFDPSNAVVANASVSV